MTEPDVDLAPESHPGSSTAQTHEASSTVHTYAGARRVIIVLGLLAIGLLTLYVAYDTGRASAGYDRVAMTRERARLQAHVRKLEQENRDLRVHIAGFDADRMAQARERMEVSRTLGELQAQVARQAQDLEFYRGIVDRSASATGVKIQQLRIASTEQPSRFRVKLTLMQTARPERNVSGSFTLRLEGESPRQGATGTPVTLDLPRLARGASRELPFSFRYFQNIEQQITVPAGFRPERLTLELRSGRRGAPPLTQSFIWTVDAP